MALLCSCTKVLHRILQGIKTHSWHILTQTNCSDSNSIYLTPANILWELVARKRKICVSLMICLLIHNSTKFHKFTLYFFYNKKSNQTARLTVNGQIKAWYFCDVTKLSSCMNVNLCTSMIFLQSLRLSYVFVHVIILKEISSLFCKPHVKKQWDDKLWWQ